MGVRWKVLFVFATIVVVYLSASDPLAVKKFSDWGPPVLVPNVNSEFDELGVAVSRDGRSLYFSSTRPGGFGGQDLWVSQRTRVKDAWGTPVNLGATINTNATEGALALSRDGHWMFLNSNRPGGSGAGDLWVSYRRNTRDDFGWGTPVNLGPNINSSFGDAGASYWVNREQDDDDDADSGNGEEDEDSLALLFFGSNRPPEGPVNFDLYVSPQNSDGTFGPPTVLSELNSICGDTRPSIRSDGLEIFFSSNRPVSGGTECADNIDLWVATRDTLSQVWYRPQNLGSVVNGASSDQQPYLSSDGRTLYFTSNRPGGPGLSDVYVTTRNKSKPQGNDDDDR
jgi:Tol biopolymer transport system component